MRSVGCFALVGIIASVAMGQSTTTAPAKSHTKGDSNSKPGAKTTAAGQVEAKPRPKRSVQQILNTRIPHVHFDSTPLTEVMEWVQQHNDALVYVRWAVLEDAGIDRKTPTSLNARDQTLSRILWVVMNEAAGSSGFTLAYQASADLFIFSTHEDLSRELITRVYDVTAITIDVPVFGADAGKAGSEGRVPRTRVRRIPPPDSRSRGGEVVPTDGVPRREITAEDEKLHEFMELILNTIEPDSWEINGMGGKGTIFPYKGRLIIYNSLYIHQKIDEALKR